MSRKISRRGFMRGALGAGAMIAGGIGCSDSPPSVDAPAKTESRPNIVYIYSDQHRADAMSVVNHPVIKTPNLDAIAAEGVTFGRCYSNSPLCRPGRACMMSGLYPREHGVWTNFMVMDQDSESHVRRLRDEAGYFTSVVGKTHLHEGSGHLDQYACILENFGFSDSIELTGPGQSAVIKSKYSEWLNNTTPPGEKNKYQRYKNYVNSYVNKYRLSPWDLPPIDSTPWGISTYDHLDNFTTRLAANWLKEYKEDKPFYLQVNLPGPHDPFDSTSEYRAMYDSEDPKMPTGVMDLPFPITGLVRQSLKFQDISSLTPEQKHRLQQTYYGKISLIDDAIATVIDTLEERGLMDNTWIIYGSDHGEMLGDHGLLNKTVFYEQSVKIPCIIRPPGGLKGWTCQGLTDQLDVTASILDIGGLGVGKGRGKSLIEKIASGSNAAKAQKGKDFVISEVHKFGMIRTEKHKLVINYKQQKAVEFFDLELDPDETVNQLRNPKYANQINTMNLAYWDAAPALT